MSTDSSHEPTALDPQALKMASYVTFKIKEGEVLSVLAYIGRRLGLFERLAAGALDTAGLASATGTQERWVREWAYTMAAAGLIERTVDDGETFGLTPEFAAVLADTDHAAYALGMFGPPTRADNVERIIEGFQTGVGMSWGDHGPEVADMQAQMSGSRQRAYLLDPTLASMGDLTDRLRAGITVYDVGCGSGTAAMVVADAFPESTVVGFDPSEPAIAAARQAAGQRTNVEFKVGTFDDLPDDGSAGAVFTLDVLHDLTHPGAATQRVAKALGSDGVWVVADIKSGDDFEDNLSNPLLPLFYGMSVMYCMNSALSVPDGAGLGTMGLTPTVLENMTEAAGFGRFRQHEFDHDVSNYWYEVRP